MRVVDVFIVSRNSRHTQRRVLWQVSQVSQVSQGSQVSQEDAMKICSDSRTFGSQHMLCWTAEDLDDPSARKFVKDSGAYAAVLAELGVTVLDSLAARAS